MQWHGVRVRALRLALRYSQQEFAEYLGASTKSVRNWESDKHGPMPVNQRALDTTAERLTVGERARFEELEGGLDPLAREARPGEQLDLDRRRLLGLAIRSAATLAIPPELATLWEHPAPRAPRTIGGADVEVVRDVTALFSCLDQRHGGGHGRTAAAEYFSVDVLPSLRAQFTDGRVRQAMFSAAGELAYLCGWMAFDDGDHDEAQHSFDLAVEFANEADDPPLAGHVLRAMAHQALDRGYRHQALALAAASVEGPRFTLACPRERALLKVVHARSLAAVRRPESAALALNQAESELEVAGPGDEEPDRVFFFREASLAHETARTLHLLNDPTTAIAQFRRSIHLREARQFARTHAVTLGYLGALHVREGNLDEACTVWAQALDLMDRIRSGRTRQVAVEIRRALAPHMRGSGTARAGAALMDVDRRAGEHLERYALTISDGHRTH